MNEVGNEHGEPLALEALLRWYVAMGVDAAIDDAPHDRFAEAPTDMPAPAARGAPQPASPRERDAALPSPTRAAAPRAAVQPGPPSLNAMPSDELVRHAEAVAAAAETIEALREGLQTLPGCSLATTAARMIFADGMPGARVMVVAGAPEADDERSGAAFSGPAGRLLDAMLRAIGHDRTSTYLAHLIPWRPPGNRPPTPLELSLCLPFARRHIELAAPAILLCLGERAAQPLLGTKDPIGKLRGRWLTWEGDTRTVKTLVTFAPDLLLKQPLQKKRAWADLLMLEAALGAAGGVADDGGMG